MTKLQTKPATLEHANITVSDAPATAQLLCELFDWKIRWSCASKDNGHTVHVGNAQDGDSYLALYTPTRVKPVQGNHKHLNNLNHIAVVVDNLDVVEKLILDRGFKTHNHGDYKPGRRFYFNLTDGVEIEVISYS